MMDATSTLTCSALAAFDVAQTNKQVLLDQEASTGSAIPPTT